MQKNNSPIWCRYRRFKSAHADRVSSVQRTSHIVGGGVTKSIIGSACVCLSIRSRSARSIWHSSHQVAVHSRCETVLVTRKHPHYKWHKKLGSIKNNEVFFLKTPLVRCTDVSLMYLRCRISWHTDLSGSGTVASKSNPQRRISSSAGSVASKSGTRQSVSLSGTVALKSNLWQNSTSRWSRRWNLSVRSRYLCFFSECGDLYNDDFDKFLEGIADRIATAYILFLCLLPLKDISSMVIVGSERVAIIWVN